MSNVLIGIIGVILFIGLALAGALFLGPKFQEASLKSEASATMGMVAQAAHGMNLYRVNEGKEAGASTTDLTTVANAGYLKGITIGGTGVFPLDRTGNTNPANPAITMVRRVGTATDTRAGRLCEIIDRDVGRTAPGQEFDTSSRTFKTEIIPGNSNLSVLEGNAGCQSNGTHFIAFARF